MPTVAALSCRHMLHESMRACLHATLQYILPAVIIERDGREQIIVDFSVSPKNGPPDFAGVWDPAVPGIMFIRDKNVWTKQP